MRLIELVIDETTGVDAISLVDEPAIEEYFLTLRKQGTSLPAEEFQHMEFATVNEEKMILLGAAMIPDKHIYRKNDDGEFYVYFSKSTIAKAAHQYMTRLRNNNHTLQHQAKVEGFSVVESWIVEDPEKDKSAAYGMSVPRGTWMVAVKCANNQIWEEYVRTGKVRGFSIEGTFLDKAQVKDGFAAMKEQKMFDKWSKEKNAMDLLSGKLIAALKKSLAKDIDQRLFTKADDSLYIFQDTILDIGAKMREMLKEAESNQSFSADHEFAKTEAEKSLTAWDKLSKKATDELEKTRRTLLKFESPIEGYANSLDNAMFHIRKAQEFIEATSKDLTAGLRKTQAFEEIEREIKKHTNS